ncbi:winged helix-turn-helix domain-containing protein [Chloroflexota bacterium]
MGINKVSDYSLPTKFDNLIHQPSRLSIVAVLAGAESVDFSYLLEVTELTKGTLSKHLTKLRDAGYVEIEKSFKDNYPHTTARLTPKGKKAFKDYRRQYIAFTKTIDVE